MGWAPIVAYVIGYDALRILRGRSTLCAQARRLARRHPDVRTALIAGTIVLGAHIWRDAS